MPNISELSPRLSGFRKPPLPHRPLVESSAPCFFFVFFCGGGGGVGEFTMRLKALKEVRERLDGRGFGGFLKNKTKAFAMLVGLGDQNSGDKINIPSARRASWGVGPDSTILNGFLKTHLLIYFTYLLFQTLQLFVLSYFFFFLFPFRFYFWTSVRLKRFQVTGPSLYLYLAAHPNPPNHPPGASFPASHVVFRSI